jgi:integrase
MATSRFPASDFGPLTSRPPRIRTTPRRTRVPLDGDVASVIQVYLLAERPEPASGRLFIVARGPSRGDPLTAAGLRRIFRYHREIAGVPGGNPHALRHTFGTAHRHLAGTGRGNTAYWQAARSFFSRWPDPAAWAAEPESAAGGELPGPAADIFRHTAAVHLLEAGVEVNAIRGWLGHADLSTTNRYAEINTRTKQEALRAVEPPGTSAGSRTRPARPAPLIAAGSPPAASATCP